MGFAEATRRVKSWFSAPAEPTLEGDLAAVGFHVENVYDLVNTAARYDAAVPVLIKWLPIATGFNEKEGIARSLAVPWASEAFPALMAEYPLAAPGTFLQGAIGLAIEATWDGVTREPEILEFATDVESKDQRSFLVYALHKSGSDESMQILIEAWRDSNTVESAVRALRIRRDVRAREELAVVAATAPRADLRRRAYAAGAANRSGCRP